jgi:hypothetical protein
MTDAFEQQRSYVKGLWFVTARRYAEVKYGEAALDAVVNSMPERYRHAMSAPLASEWYEEEALGHALRAARDVLAGGADERMLAVLEASTLEGINRFWRTALRVASTELALRMLPASWRHVRRGPGTLEVDVRGRSAVVHYARFPYFNDVNYRLLVLGTLRPLMRIATGVQAHVEISGYGMSWLDAKISFP